MGLFRRKRSGPPTPEELLAEGREVQPSSVPDNGIASDFRMVVGDVFLITGRGVVVTGTVAEGTVAVDATIEVSRNGTAVRTFRVKAIEVARRGLQQVGPGASIGLLLADAERHELQSGDVVTCPQPGGPAATSPS